MANARVKTVISQSSGNLEASEMFETLFDKKMCEIEATIRAKVGASDLRELATVPSDLKRKSTRRALAGYELSGSKVCASNTR